MGPELEMERKSNILMEASVKEQRYGCASQDPQSKFMNYGRVLSDGKAQVQNGSDDIEIDITGCTESMDYGPVNTDFQGVTETSSSFGETISGTESVSTLNDIEVESTYNGGNILASEFNGYNEEFPIRKKKLTDHWRRFIRPIKWRSKWIELQIKELHLQALKYDRELAEYGHRRQLEFENRLAEGCGAKSLPLNCQVKRNHVMERKKRRRVEDTTDLASYMSTHNIFSYHENKKSMADGAFLDNYCSNLGNKTIHGIDVLDSNNEWQSLIFRNCDNSLEQMLWKIDMLQSQVCKLKARVDKVVSENPGKFCSVNKLSALVPCNALNGSDENAAYPTKNGNGILDRSHCLSSQHMSDDSNMGDLFVPESTVSTHGEVTPRPDLIDTTVQPFVGVSRVNNKEGISLENQTSEEELHNFERVINRLTEKKSSPSSPVLASESDAPRKPSVSCGQPSTSRSNLRSNKRKWGKQKSRSTRWSRKPSG